MKFSPPLLYFSLPAPVLPAGEGGGGGVEENRDKGIK